MRKAYLVSALIFFLLSWVVLALSPTFKAILQEMLDNADLLFPFSVYNGMLNPAASPEWIFGGYTPFLELALGFVIWLPTRNIPLTLVVYAAVQQGLVVFSILYLARCVAGRNVKVTALALFTAGLSNLVCAAGGLRALEFQYYWYVHVTTVALGLIALGLTVRFAAAEPALDRHYRPTLLKLGAVCAVAVMSDALFLSQLVAPALAVLLVMARLSIISMRRAGLAILSLLGSSAIGVALFRIPQAWGSQRLGLDGFYLRTGLDWIAGNFQAVARVLAAAWEGSLAVNLVWALFYVLSLGAALSAYQRLRKKRIGCVRRRLALCLAILPLQLVSTVGAGLLTVEPNLRYFFPIVFIPLAWGWPLLAVAFPRWMKLLRGRVGRLAGPALAGAAVLLLAAQLAAASRLPASLQGYYPADVRCVDENAARLGLRAGMAQYWQARRFTLFSRAGLEVVQVRPDLSAYPVLSDLRAYDRDFDFVIAEINPLYTSAFGRDAVVRRFGEPASSFVCGGFEGMVYNRPGDLAFARQFAGLASGSGK